MKLGELLTALPGASITAVGRGIEITSLVHDSRKVGPGALFVALRGFHADGHRFVGQAFRQGAAAAIVEERSADAPADAVQIVLPDTRRALALLADAFYNSPSRRLRLVGVTGTNGKTTTTYLVRSIIEAAGSTAGLIGTIDYRVGNKVYPAPNTTPESLELQRMLAEMAYSGADTCVMEVSSHALALDRTLGCVFRVAAFTNLTQDHLDFHRTLESYFEAKLLLFRGLAPDAHAVVNLDDPRAVEVIKATKARVITTGTASAADVRPVGAISHGIEGLTFDVATPAGTVAVQSPLVGRHNVENILTAVGIGTGLGIPPEVIGKGIAAMRAVPGRMEKVEAGQPFGVIVDYAHTEDALKRLLEAVREIARGRVITLFGCGGDRDRTKRPKMGKAALAGSDLVIVTSDNPRSEDPQAIAAEIEAGMAAGRKVSDIGPASAGSYAVILDRREAIRAAINAALPGDVVVLAGKGHEDYQIIGDRKLHFDDREVAREALG